MRQVVSNERSDITLHRNDTPITLDSRHALVFQSFAKRGRLSLEKTTIDKRRKLKRALRFFVPPARSPAPVPMTVCPAFNHDLSFPVPSSLVPRLYRPHSLICRLTPTPPPSSPPFRTPATFPPLPCILRYRNPT